MSQVRSIGGPFLPVQLMFVFILFIDHVFIAMVVFDDAAAWLRPSQATSHLGFLHILLSSLSADTPCLWLSSCS